MGDIDILMALEDARPLAAGIQLQRDRPDIGERLLNAYIEVPGEPDALTILIRARDNYVQAIIAVFEESREA